MFYKKTNERGDFMKKTTLIGAMLMSSAVLLAGCSSRIEIGPVPSVTPRAESDAKPTATPTPVVQENSEDENAAPKKNYKEQYAETGKLPSIYEIYKDKVLIGLETSKEDVTDKTRQELVTQQFGFVSCRTELSANTLMDYEATKASGDLKKAVLDFSGADEILKYAKENGKSVRGPVLISQNMPDWFFTSDFSETQVTETVLEDGTTEKTLEFASAETMLLRMENYIKDIMEHCNTNYPDVVVSWDVLSDAINSVDKMDKKYRNSYWYQVAGEEYIIKAYEYANSYKSGSQKLFYREDGLDDSLSKTAITGIVKLIQEKSSIDGFALDIPINIQAPNMFGLEDMFKLANQTGLELHLMNFCAGTITNSQDDQTRTEEESLEKCAKRYKALMNWIEKAQDAQKYNLTQIVFGGLTDDMHADNQPREYVDSETGETVVGVPLWNYAYLFDKDLNPKDAFFGALQDDGIKAY